MCTTSNTERATSARPDQGGSPRPLPVTRVRQRTAVLHRRANASTAKRDSLRGPGVQGPFAAHRERGVALVTVLLIVVIAVLLGVSMSTAQNLAIHRTRNHLEQIQVRQYALGGEELARQILHEDFRDAPTKDHLTETWASPELNYEYDDGEIRLEIVDLQSRFNLNNLVGEGGRGLARDRFARLLALLGVDAVFVDRITDWADPDQNSLTMGAEDYDYLGLERPYRSANQPISDISELRMLLDMDPESFDRLAPYITALPIPDAAVNVNTAEPLVIQALVPNVTGDIIENVLVQRFESEGLNSVAEFYSALGTPPGTSQQGVGVQSAFFEINVTARYHERFGYLKSIVQRDPVDGSLRVIYRTFMRALPVVAANNLDDDSV